MSKIDVTIRLYKKQDLDLYSLYQCPNFFLSKAIRQVVNSYTNDSPIMIDLPDEVELVPLSQLQQCIQFHIVFTEKKDGPETIAFLKNILPGYRNNFIKNLIRCHLNGMQMRYYFLNTPEIQSSAPTKTVTVEVPKKQSIPKEKKQSGISIPSVEDALMPKETSAPKESPVQKEQKEKKENTSEPIIHIAIGDNQASGEEMVGEMAGKNIMDENEMAREMADTDDDFDLFGSIENMLSNM